MFSVGEVFVYGSVGVCRIGEICERSCGAEKREYYVLCPIYDERSTLYVPTDSEALLSHLNPLLTKDAAEELIAYVPKKNPVWNLNDKERMEEFRKILESGNRREILSMVYMLHKRKKELFACGKRLRSSDESLMQRAEKLLCDEFAYVLGFEPAEVMKRLREHENF